MPTTTARELVWNIVDGEAMILDVTSGDYFSLNPVATEIWVLLQQGSSREEIVRRIARKYASDEATVEGDFAELLADLHASRLWGTE